VLQDRIATRYAKATFDYASDKKSVQAVVRDFKVFEQLIKESQEFRTFIRTPLINAGKKWVIYEKAFSSKAQEVTTSLMRLLIERRREVLLPIIIDSFMDLYNRANNQTRVELICAEPLPKTLRLELIAKLEAQLATKVMLHERINPDIIDGYQIKVGNLLYDASIAGDLRRIRKLLHLQSK